MLQNEMIGADALVARSPAILYMGLRIYIVDNACTMIRATAYPCGKLQQ